jgi:cell division control protein 6
MYGEILEEEMARESVFRDQSKLSPDYVPQELVHRDEEFRKLSRLFRPVLESRASQRVLVTGSVGVGKTTLALKFGQQLEPAAKKRNFRLDYIHINCRKQKTPYTVLRQMIGHYNPRLPPRGFSPEELLGMVIDWLDKHDAYLTLTLDELGFFIQQNGPDLLYSLTRAAEESGAQNRLSIIAISRGENFLRLLDPATQSTFMHNLIKLDKYNARQLADILTQRIREAFKAGMVEEDTVSLIADIAARWGDARFALELLLHAGMFADEKKAKKVTPEHARQAKAEVHPEVRKEVLAELQLHERLLLLALARRLKITERAYALTGEVEEAYRVVCEEHGEEPRKHTQLWGYLKRMDGLGLVDTQPSGKPHRGRSKRISVPDVPVLMLEKELEKLLKKKG